MKRFFIKPLSYSLLSLIAISCCNVEPPTPFGACPSPQQLDWQQMEMNMFCHFGPNTFSGLEWGNGDESASIFNPTALDCSQWVTTAANAGMGGIIITAKHHDGFCLWPSAQSTHTVAQSAWRNGKGDVLRELREAIDNYNAAQNQKNQQLKMGVYISPWDRNHPSYGTPQYNHVFASTLIEVHQNYGPLFEQWLDGANGEGPNGKKQDYDWSLINSTLTTVNPTVVTFSDVGPGCRWVGNESGEAGTTCWSTLNTDGFTPGAGSPSTDTLNQGNRGGKYWIPAETDVSIRPGWFWHPTEHPKSLQELLKIYYSSVGRNSLLLLNIPPDTAGRIPTEDSLRLVELHNALLEIFANDLASTAKVKASDTRGGKHNRHFSPKNLLNDDYDSYWAAPDECLTPMLTLSFKNPVTFNRLMIQEYIPLGQRVAKFHVDYLDPNGNWQRLTEGTTIGYKRIMLTSTTTTTALRICIDEAMACPVLNRVGLFLDQISNEK